MGGKKKAAKAGKKKDEEEDLSVEHFYKAYKKKITEFDPPVTLCKAIKEKYDNFLEEEEVITKFHLWDELELGWSGVKAIMDALR